jgi:Ca2+-binding RTX toxin-like protein
VQLLVAALAAGLVFCAALLAHSAHASQVQCVGTASGDADAGDAQVVGGLRERNAITAGSKGLSDLRIIDAGFKNRGVPLNVDVDCAFPPSFTFDTMNIALGSRGDLLFLVNPKGMRADGFTKLERHILVRADGGSQSDFLLGHAGIDVLRGQTGRDGLFGADGDDSLRGGAGMDVGIGGKGHDVLMGQAGRDVLLARDGEADVLRCGAGRDLYDADPSDTVAHTCEKNFTDLVPLSPAQHKLLQKLHAAK